MKDKQIKFGAILSYVQMAVNVLVVLIYTPLMIRTLGKSEYGLYNTVSSTISMLSILSLGFGSGYIRFFSRYKAQRDEMAIYRLNGLFLLIFCFIGSVAFGCGLYISNHLRLVFKDGLTSAELEIAKKLMLLLTVNLSLSFPMSVFSSIISANERFVFLKLMGMGKTVLGPFLTIPLLLSGYGSVGVVCITLLVSLTVDAANIYYVLVKLHNRFFFSSFDRSVGKELFAYTVFIALNILIDQINWNVDKVLLGRYKGSASVAIYSVASTLQTYYQMFSTSISDVFTPRIHRIVSNARSENEKCLYLSQLFTQIGRIQCMILCLILSGFFFWGRTFIRIWAGVAYEDAYDVALLLMVPVTVPLMQNLGIEIQRSQNRHQFRSLVYGAMAMANLLMTIPLCQRYGEVGAAFGTAVSLLLANGIIMNIYYHKRCGINILAFWRSILKLVAGLIPAFGIGVALKYLIGSNTVWKLLLGIALYTVAYISCLLTLAMTVSEKAYVKSAAGKWLGLQKYTR